MNKKLMTTVALVAAMSLAAPAFAQDASASAGADANAAASTAGGDAGANAGADASASAGDNGANAGADASTAASTGTDNGNTTTSVDASASVSTEGGGSSTNVGIQTNIDVNINTQQTTEIHQVILDTHVSPVTVNFDINLGVAVPNTVTLAPLPARVIELVPQFKGYLFFMLADGRIIIVAPDTFKIVAILAV